MSELFPSLKKKTVTADSFDWSVFETTVEEAANHCNLCKDIDWQDQDELNVCKACGTVTERPLDMGAEYRNFADNDHGTNDRCRVGPPIDPRLPDPSLSTIILGGARGGHPSARKEMLRIRRQHTWTSFTYKKKTFLNVFENMTLAAVNHGIEVRVIDIAKDLFVQLVEHCEKRGLSRSSIIASCIYSALKMVGAPRKPKDVADIFHLQNAQFTKAFKDFQCVLAMAKQKGLLSQATVIPSQLKTTHAADYIALPLSKLTIQRGDVEMLRAAATRVAEAAEEQELSKENMPPSLASAVIAFTLARCGYDKITTAEIATACDVSEGTLMKCLRRLEQSEDVLYSMLGRKG